MSAEAIIAALAMSTIASAAAGGGVLMLERATRDPRLRVKAWSGALYLSGLPAALVAVHLLVPADTVRLSAWTPLAVAIDASSARIATTAIHAALVVAAVATACRLVSLTRRLWCLHGLVGASRPASPALVDLIGDLARSQGAPTTDVRIADDGIPPLVTGFCRPVLLLPPDLQREPFGDAARRTIVHELTHVVRGDHRAIWIEEIVALVLAANPFVAALRTRLAAAREEVCDASALSTASSGQRRAYAEALVNAFSSQRQAWVGLSFIGTNRRNLAMRRLHQIFHPTPAASAWTRRGLVLAGSLLTGVMATGTAVLAEQTAGRHGTPTAASLAIGSQSLSETTQDPPRVLRPTRPSVSAQAAPGRELEPPHVLAPTSPRAARAATGGPPPRIVRVNPPHVIPPSSARSATPSRPSPREAPPRIIRATPPRG